MADLGKNIAYFEIPNGGFGDLGKIWRNHIAFYKLIQVFIGKIGGFGDLGINFALFEIPLGDLEDLGEVSEFGGFLPKSS